MKTPGFWHTPNFIATLLIPLAWAYGYAARWRMQRATPLKFSVPVICIGNVVAGGAGKTPVTIAIGEYFKEQHLDAWFISRGYGGKLRGPLIVQPSIHTASEVGDEPLLLAKTLPTAIGRNRREACRFAIAQGAKILIMDDGFQNPFIRKDISLLVIDGAYGLGNGKLIPAGPLRESLIEASKRTDAIVFIGEDRQNIMAQLPYKNILPSDIHPVGPHPWISEKLLAFAGLGRPEKFFTSLRQLGANLAETIAFPDHHAFASAELEMLRKQAQTQDAVLITTRKDFVRLPPDFRKYVQVLDIRWQPRDEGSFRSLFNSIIPHA